MIIEGFFHGLKPEPILTVSAWADTYRFLSTEASAEPGRWRTDRTPFLREILDKLSSMDVTEEVIVMKRSRIRNKRRDKRVFSRTAAGAHPKNLLAGPMRGGFRL